MDAVNSFNRSIVGVRGTCLRTGLLLLSGMLGMVRFEAVAAQSVALAWNANSESDLAGYRVYYGTTSRVYGIHLEVAIPAVASTTVSASVTGLQPGQRYYFAVTALARDGFESGYSQEVTYSMPNPAMPPVVTESFVVSEHAEVDAGPPPTKTDEVVEVEALTPAENAVLMATSVSNPRLAIVPVGRPVVAFSVSFDTPVNRACELQVSRDLVHWQLLVPFAAAPTSRRFAFMDAVDAEPLRFYRVRSY